MAAPRPLGPLERILGIPDVLKALGTLPDILERLDRVADATQSLPQVEQALTEVSIATAALPRNQEQMESVSVATISMERHTAALMEAIPGLAALGEGLPPLLTSVTEALNELQVSLQGMEAEVHSLAHIVEPLEGAAERLGRFADRLPQRKRNGRRKTDQDAPDDDDDVAERAQDAAV
jgi:uncharacterized protein YoxC